jgi:Phosphopantetheine attachment site/AMP-binding enzyme C-terminal domain
MGNMDEAREHRMRAQLQAIEARLVEHPQVAAGAAIVRDDRLIAYVVARIGEVADEDALRSHLKATLPAYMVPRHLVALASLPLAADGTLDRSALPEPHAAIPATPAIAAPGGDVDTRVAYLIGIWSPLLGRDVGPDDNFFDLGGHSMLAVQMANRVKADTGARIQLMTLASQTLAQIAAELPSVAKSPSTGFGARIVGNLKGMLRGAGAAGQS